MAFPVVEAVSETSIQTDATSHTINRPSGVSGRLSIVIVATDGIPTLTHAGYTQFGTRDQGSNIGLRLLYRQEDGTEGTTFSLSTSVVEKIAVITYQISGAENPATQVPEATLTGSGTTTANIDPPSLTPTGGAKDYLWIAVAQDSGEDANDDTNWSSSPANYTPSPPHQVSTDLGGAATTNTLVAAAQRNLNAASEDPGTFTAALNVVWQSATIAVHPGAVAAPGPGPTALNARRAARASQLW